MSFVVAARNDNYGGDFTCRIQVFLNVLSGWLERHPGAAELIVVEWNPPPGPRLRDALAWPASKALAVRIVEVPAEMHRALPNSARAPMYEYLAKNVGIRRARGRCIVVTNPDLVYSRELVDWLCTGTIAADAYYRIDRYDFRGIAPAQAGAAAAVRFAKRNTFIVHFRLEEGRGGSRPIERWRRVLGPRLRRWPSSLRRHDARPGGERTVLLEDDTGAFGGIHTNGAGDFILASREHWHAIRGFPEYTDTFTHLDAYGCHQLKALGLRQRVILPPAMILHADHSRAEQQSRPRLPEKRILEELGKIRCGGLGPALNPDDWGFAAARLPEQAL